MLLGLLLIFAGRLYTNSRILEASYAPFGKLREALAYLEHNFAKQLKIEDVALEYGLSPDQFARLTKQQVGLSPLQYLQNIRLSQAMELLLDENLQVAEIATLVGFEAPITLPAFFVSVQVRLPPSFARKKANCAKSVLTILPVLC